MTKRAEELWTEFMYRTPAYQGDFERALDKYGQEVREAAARECKKERLTEPMGETDEAYDRAVDDCAEAVRRMPLP